MREVPENFSIKSIGEYGYILWWDFVDRNGDEMDKRKSVLNVTVSVGFRLLTMIMSIVVKRILINTCGNEVNGLNSLCLSIIGILSVAELGLGTAITFSMYKPIVEGKTDQIAALYHLFRKMYLSIGGFIFTVGVCLMPILPHFAKDYALLNVNIYVAFFIMLLSVVLTYLFSEKLALFNAYKNNYVTTSVTSGGNLLQYVLQIGVLFLFKSFLVYLICRVVTALVQWCVTEYLVRKAYAPILARKAQVDFETKAGLIKSIKAMFMHKVGYVLVNSVDSIVISMFIGVVSLGEYSNYITVLSAVNGVLSLVFTSLTSVIGHLYVTESKERTSEYCKMFHMINFCLGVVFFLGCYAVIDDLISMFFSTDLVISRSISFTLVLNGFIQFMRQSVMVFRDATGTFYYDRWKPLAEGIFNVVFSVLFVKVLGMAGVIAATIATNLCICHVVEPYVLFKKAFDQSPKQYYLKNYFRICLFAILMCFMDQFMIASDSHLMKVFVNGSISIVLSGVISIAVMMLNGGVRKNILITFLKR